MSLSAFPVNLVFRFLLLLLFCFPVNTMAQKAKKIYTIQPGQDSVKIAAGEKYLRSGFHRFWFGKHYRRVWAEPVMVPVFKNPTGTVEFTPLKMGGSYQTKNLRLADAEGREYVIRSIDKDPSRALPALLRKTFVANLMRDQTSVIHPYGAFIVPKLAAAAGIYHTNPTLVYLGDSAKLGKYSDEFSGLLVLLEERPEGNRKEIASFGNSEKILGSDVAFKEIYNDNCHRLDATFYLRNRLFDMWIGDWSRREDQWRWATFKQNENTVYKAIPRDRDHAFFMFNDGVITRMISWFKPTYQTFSEDFKNIEGLTRTARAMDLFFLAMLQEETFAAEAGHLKNNLTDAVIKTAVATWPENIYSLTGETFVRKLTARREQLPEVARKYYQILNEEITLPGTDKAERFVLERLENGDVKVAMYDKKDPCSGDSLIAQKTFDSKLTKTISVYGLGGKDIFEVSGSGKKKIKLFIYPGAGEDKITLQETGQGSHKKTIVYSNPDGDEINIETEGHQDDSRETKARDYDAAGWLLRHRLD